MNSRKEIVPVQLANGVKMHVEATVLGGEEDVAFRILSFEQVVETVEGIATALTTIWQKVKPHKACAEFGVEMAVEAGELTALLVNASGTATLKISLEWGEQPNRSTTQ